MWAKKKMKSKRLAVVGVFVGVVALAAACDPGWTSAAVGTGDGSGTVPGSVEVPDADVALDRASSTLDLGARGFLTYDGTGCRLYRTDDGSTTLFAGNGTCGDSGDGGPATDASIYVLAPSVGFGMQVDDQGNVLLATFTDAGDVVIRKIDPSGTITRVPTQAGLKLDLFGIATGDGGLAYLLYSATGEGTFTYEIHEIDDSGVDHLVVSWSGSGGSKMPRGFVEVGPDHWVVIGGDFFSSGDQVLVDIDHGTVTTTDLVYPLELGTTDRLVLCDADAAGNLYGFTLVDVGDGYSWYGNRVVRIRPDGTIDVIAGSGTEDPEISRQMGTGADLDLTAFAVSVTRNGNLLISSGHTVYRMIDAAAAPAITIAGT